MAAAFETGADVLPGAPAQNRQIALTAQALGEFALNPGVQGGIRYSTQFFDFLNPALRFVAPAQTVCNYATLLARNAQDHLEHQPGRDRHGPAVHRACRPDRLTPSARGSTPEQRERPLVRPGELGATPEASDNNFLHANPYPNTASPGQQPRECEAGNEPYLPEPGGDRQRARQPGHRDGRPD